MLLHPGWRHLHVLEELLRAIASTHQNDAITTHKHHFRVALDCLSCQLDSVK